MIPRISLRKNREVDAPPGFDGYVGTECSRRFNFEHPTVYWRSTTKTVKLPGFAFDRPPAGVSISAADKNKRLVFGSNAMVFALFWVRMSPTDSYSFALFWWITETVPPPFDAKINLLSE